MRNTPQQVKCSITRCLKNQFENDKGYQQACSSCKKGAKCEDGSLNHITPHIPGARAEIRATPGVTTDGGSGVKGCTCPLFFSGQLCGV